MHGLTGVGPPLTDAAVAELERYVVAVGNLPGNQAQRLLDDVRHLRRALEVAEADRDDAIRALGGHSCAPAVRAETAQYQAVCVGLQAAYRELEDWTGRLVLALERIASGAHEVNVDGRGCTADCAACVARAALGAGR